MSTIVVQFAAENLLQLQIMLNLKTVTICHCIVNRHYLGSSYRLKCTHFMYRADLEYIDGFALWPALLHHFTKSNTNSLKAVRGTKVGGIPVFLHRCPKQLCFPGHRSHNASSFSDSNPLRNQSRSHCRTIFFPFVWQLFS